MRDKLTWLIKNAHNAAPSDYTAEFVASFLLANGVIALPCKVGDAVWIKGDRFPAEIKQIIIHEEGFSFDYVEVEHNYEDDEVWNDGSFDIKDIGKTVFFTREAAEAAVECDE